MFGGSLRKSQIVLFQFGVYSSWREISDFLFAHFEFIVCERRFSGRGGGQREGWGVCLLD